MGASTTSPEKVSISSLASQYNHTGQVKFGNQAFDFRGKDTRNARALNQGQDFESHVGVYDT